MSSASVTKERPIIMQGHNVLKCIDGTKTQTRRVIKDSWWRCLDPEDEADRASAVQQCPYGKPGDRLRVKEKWRTHERPSSGFDGILYEAGEFRAIENTMAAADNWVVAHDNGKHGDKWRSPMFMPCWASRLTLEITGVRVERLQDISEADAKAEGVEAYPDADEEPEFDMAGGPTYSPPCYHRNGFWQTWDTINGKRPGCTWADNPWTWVLDFKLAPAPDRSRPR